MQIRCLCLALRGFFSLRFIFKPWIEVRILEGTPLYTQRQLNNLPSRCSAGNIRPLTWSLQQQQQQLRMPYTVSLSSCPCPKAVALYLVLERTQRLRQPVRHLVDLGGRSAGTCPKTGIIIYLDHMEMATRS